MVHKKEQEQEKEEQEEEEELGDEEHELGDEEQEDGEEGAAETAEETQKHFSEFMKDRQKRGIIYVGHVPPKVHPGRMKALLSQFGKVERVYFTPESHDKKERRAKRGGNHCTLWEDGWVEFADKRIAKRVAESINNTPMGGSRRALYHDDLWCVKYLPGFTWDDLTGKQAHERQLQRNLATAAVNRAQKESSFYFGQATKARHLREREQKKKEKVEATVPSDETQPSAPGMRKLPSPSPFESSPHHSSPAPLKRKLPAEPSIDAPKQHSSPAPLKRRRTAEPSPDAPEPKKRKLQMKFESQ